MGRYHGQTGLAYVSASAATAAVSFTRLTAWSISYARDMADATSCNDANKIYTQGLKDVSGSISGWWDDGIEGLFTAADSATGCNIYLYPAAAALTKYHYGLGWMDMSVDLTKDGTVAIKTTFKAAGSWGRL